MKFPRKYGSAVIMLTVFESIAVVLWLTMDNLFYLFNFSYIGCSIALGLVLYANRYKHARRIVQLLVGNLLYYGVGIALAFALRDNRAFCKYISLSRSIAPSASDAEAAKKHAPWMWM